MRALDHIDRTLGHAVGEFLDGDGFGNRDTAHDLGGPLIEHLIAPLALARPAHRGEAASALILVERLGEVETAGAAGAGAGRGAAQAWAAVAETARAAAAAHVL